MGVVAGGMTSPATPMISVGSSTPGTSQPCYVSVMQLGCQVLARLLGCSGDSDADLPKYDFTLGKNIYNQKLNIRTYVQ